LDEKGESIYGVWDDELGITREAFAQGEMSEQKLADTELEIIEKIAKRIGSEIDYKEVSHVDKTFDLTEVIDQKLANCQGYSQLFWILANSLGLTSW
jgi:transglutaminase/protease-like cytokinesis protein 3